MTFADSISSHIDDDDRRTVSKRFRIIPSRSAERSGLPVCAFQERMPFNETLDPYTFVGVTACSSIPYRMVDRAISTSMGRLTIVLDRLWPTSTTWAPLPVHNTNRDVSIAAVVPMAAAPAHRSYAIGMRLDRLKDGWNGPGSLAPSPDVTRDVYSVLIAFDSVRLDPQIEVDDDGTVVLEWQCDGRAFALTFMGNGYVVGTVSPRSGNYPAWRVRVDDEAAIADKLSEQSLNGFVREA